MTIQKAKITNLQYLFAIFKAAEAKGIDCNGMKRFLSLGGNDFISEVIDEAIEKLNKAGFPTTETEESLVIG